MHLGLTTTLGPVGLGGEKSGFSFSYDFSASWRFNNNGNPYSIEKLETTLQDGFWSFPGIDSEKRLPWEMILIKYFIHVLARNLTLSFYANFDKCAIFCKSKPPVFLSPEIKKNTICRIRHSGLFDGHIF